MEKLNLPKIRKISIGENPISDKNNILILTVGQHVRLGKEEAVISDIEVDENNFYFFGNVRYCVYVKKTDGSEHLWKFFERMPVSVE